MNNDLIFTDELALFSGWIRGLGQRLELLMGSTLLLYISATNNTDCKIIYFNFDLSFSVLS